MRILLYTVPFLIFNILTNKRTQKHNKIQFMLISTPTCFGTRLSSSGSQLKQTCWTRVPLF